MRDRRFRGKQGGVDETMPVNTGPPRVRYSFKDALNAPSDQRRRILECIKVDELARSEYWRHSTAATLNPKPPQHTRTC